MSSKSPDSQPELDRLKFITQKASVAPKDANNLSVLSLRQQLTASLPIDCLSPLAAADLFELLSEIAVKKFDIKTKEQTFVYLSARDL